MITFKTKGMIECFKAFSQISKADVTLVIIGHNSANWMSSCWKQCNHNAQRYNRKVLLLNNAPRSHVIGAYQAATLFVSGSYVEAFPIVILEAMGCGVPFVAFPAGNIEHLPGGIVVHSVNEMSVTLERLMYNESERIGVGTSWSERTVDIL